MLLVPKWRQIKTKHQVVAFKTSCVLICFAVIAAVIPLGLFAIADSNKIEIVNSDFSQVSEDGLLIGWTASPVDGAFGSLKQETKDSYDGAYAEIASSDGVWNLDTSLSSLIEVEAATEYKITYYAKLDGENAGLSAWYCEYGEDGSATPKSYGIITGTTVTGKSKWGKYTSSFKTSDKVKFISLRFSVNKGTAGVDAVSLAKKGALKTTLLSFGNSNILQNGGFENGLDGWSKSISGSASVTVVTDNVAEGTSALKMNLPDSASQGYLQGNQFDVEPSQKYIFSYKLKIEKAKEGNNAQCYALIYEFASNGSLNGGGLIDSTGRWNTADGDYETVTCEFTTKSNTKKIRIDLMHNAVAGISYWDDISVVKAQSEPETENDGNLLPNGGFEKDFESWIKNDSNGAASSIVTNTVAEGGKALKMNLPTASAQCYMQGMQFALEPSKTYELSYKLKIENKSQGNNAQCYALVYEFAANGAQCAGGLISSTGRWNTVNGEYETVTYQFTTNVNTKTARVDLMHNGVAGTSYWDAVTIKEVTAPEEDNAVLKNGDFSKGTENWSLNGNVSVQSKVSVEGNALKIENNSAQVCYAQSNFFDVEPNKVYIISYDINVTDVKVESEGVNFSSFICADGYWLDFATSSVYKKTNGFEHIKTAVTIPENIEHIAFGLKNYNGNGTAYIDNVVFTKTDLDGTNPNLDFEANEEMVLNWAFSTDNGKVETSNLVRDGSTGKVAAMVTNSTESGYATLKTKQIPVKPDTVYQFSYWVKIDGTYTSGASLTFHQLKKDGTGATCIVSEANADTVNSEKHQAISEFVHATWTYRASGDYKEWRNVTYSVKTASDAEFMETHISVTGGECTAIIDDASLTEVKDDPNLDFENISEITGTPENWYMSCYHQTSKGIGYDDKVYHSGNKSLYIEKNSNLEKIYIQSPVKFPVNKSYIYEFSAYVVSKNASPDCTAKLDLIMYDENGEQLYNDIYGNMTTVCGEMLALNGSSEMGQWKKMMTRSVPDSRAAYASLSFTVTNGSAEIWIDDIFFNVVDNNIDTVVDYSDFHAVDQNGKISDWEVEGNGNLKTELSPTENDSNNRIAVFTANSADSYMKHKVDFNETGYVYCIKGELVADTVISVQMRFYDYKGKEYIDKRIETSVNPAQNTFELNYTAESCTTAVLLIGGKKGTVKVNTVTFYQTGAPAGKTQWTGKWVWYNEDPYQAQDNYRYFRYTFALEDDVKDAPFQITVDDKYALYVNGVEVTNNWDAGGDSWANVCSLHLEKYLKKGANVIAVKAYNYVSEAGILFDGKFTLNNQNTVSVYSDSESVVTSKSCNDDTLDWTKVSYDDSGWESTKEFGTPPCSPWGPVHYNSSLYIHNAATVISTKTPSLVSAGGTMEFSLTLKLSSKMESGFTPKVTIWRKNSLLSLATSSIRFIDRKNVLEWPVGEEFTVKCELDIPSYMDTGKYVLQMDEYSVLLDGEDVFDNKFLNFNVQGDENGVKSLTSKIEEYNGTPTLMIDGEPYGSFFYLRPDLDVYLSTDAETRIYKSDLDLYITYGGSLYKGGTNGSNPIWREDGTIDYDAFDSTVYDTLAANGNAYVMVNIGMFAPEWWLASHPDDVVLSLGIDGKEYKQSDVSLGSETFRKEAGEVLRKLIKHMKEQTYYNRVFGIKISGGQTYEWMNWGVGAKYGPDYSKASKDGFKKYLKSKYKTVDALRKAWNNSEVTFETANSPTYYDTTMNGSNKSFYLGSVESGSYPQNIVDWNLWLSESVTDSFLYYCQIAKEETDNNLIVGGYNGYIWTFNSYDALGKSHTSFDRVLDSEYVDWIASPENYGERMLGQSNTYMTMTGSVMSHGKIYISEQDNRTSLSTTYASSWDGEWSFSTGVEHTLQNTVYAEKRDFAHALTDGSGEWLYDMYGGWLDDDQIYDFISDSKAEFDFSLNINKNNLNDVAVIVGDESYAYMCADTNNNMQYTLNYSLLQVQRAHLAAMGAGYDTYVMSSFLDNKVPEHKLYIILSPTEIDAEMNNALNKHLKVNGHCVVWVYLPGISDGEKYSLENIKNVTGYSVGITEKTTSLNVEITDGNNPLTKGLKGVVYGDKTPLGISPAAYIKDTLGVTVLGKNVELGLPGLGIKDMGKWTSVYSTAPCLTVDMLRNLLKMTGCHIYSESNGDVVYNNSNYVALHSSDAGNKTITLPENHSVYDVYEEKFVSMDTNSFTYFSEQNDTHIFRLLTPNKYAVTSRVKGGNGKISVVGLTEVNPGEDITFDITPNDGYEISSVTVNGEKVEAKSGRLTLKDIHDNYAIIVSFSRIAKSVVKETFDDGETLYGKSYTVSRFSGDGEETVPSSHEKKVKRVDTEKVSVIGAIDIPLWQILVAVAFIGACVFTVMFFVKKRKKDE